MTKYEKLLAELKKEGMPHREAQKEASKRIKADVARKAADVARKAADAPPKTTPEPEKKAVKEPKAEPKKEKKEKGPKLKIQEPENIDKPRCTILEGQIRRGVTLARINKILEGNNVFKFTINQAGNQVIITAPGIRIPLKGYLTLK